MASIDTLALIYISFSLYQESYTQLLTFYDLQLTKNGEVGKGVIVYIGKQNETGSLFLGYCNATTSYLLKFSNKEGIELFKTF